ncbi:hypothetical protein HK102_006850 [Quaeritorhiza haematococci]|nr:hypothetical protein HK102_006850 [Quaeritorhiza haematococci]
MSTLEDLRRLFEGGKDMKHDDFELKWKESPGASSGLTRTAIVSFKNKTEALRRMREFGYATVGGNCIKIEFPSMCVDEETGVGLDFSQDQTEGDIYKLCKHYGDVVYIYMETPRSAIVYFISPKLSQAAIDGLGKLGYIAYDRKEPPPSSSPNGTPPSEEMPETFERAEDEVEMTKAHSEDESTSNEKKRDFGALSVDNELQRSNNQTSRGATSTPANSNFPKAQQGSSSQSAPEPFAAPTSREPRSAQKSTSQKQKSKQNASISKVSTPASKSLTEQQLASKNGSDESILTSPPPKKKRAIDPAIKKSKPQKDAETAIPVPRKKGDMQTFYESMRLENLLTGYPHPVDNTAPQDQLNAPIVYHFIDTMNLPEPVTSFAFAGRASRGPAVGRWLLLGGRV